MTSKHTPGDAGSVSRRDVLKLMGVGIGGAALAPILSACGTSKPASSAAKASTAASTGAATSSSSASASGSGKTITYSVQSFAHDALKPFLDEFTQKTGITVKLQSGPATGQDLLTQLIPAFNSGSSPYDVVDADDPSCAAFMHGGFFLPLDDALDKSYWDDLTPGMLEADKTWNKADGKTYRVYHDYECGYFWTRGDILSAQGAAAPTTWDELVSVGTQVKGKTGMYAFADAASKPGLMFVYMAYLTAQAGGDLYKFDDGTRKAFQYAHDLIYTHGIFPKEALTWTYDQLNTSYMQDKLLTMREWTFFDGVSKGNKSWYSAQKVQIAPPPAGPGGSKTWGGGWGMAIPKSSKNQDAAKEFVKFMNSNDVAARVAAASSFFVTARKSVFAAVPDGMVAQLKTYAEGDHIAPRPFHQQAAQAESVIDDVAQSYLTNQMSLDDAMKQGAQRIQSLS